MMVVHHQSWMAVAGCVDLITPLGHSLIDDQELEPAALCVRFE